MNSNRFTIDVRQINITTYFRIFLHANYIILKIYILCRYASPYTLLFYDSHSSQVQVLGATKSRNLF